MILVTFALPFESAGFRRTRAARDVVVVHTGMGAGPARAAVAEAIAKHAPSLVLSSGFAGGLDPSLKTGDFLVEGGPTSEFPPGTFITVEDVLVMAEQKVTLRERTGASAVDMETDGIRAACEEAGVRLVIARAISDGATEDIGLPPELLRGLATRPLATAPAVAWQLLTRAGPRRAFLRMIRGSRAAQRSLAESLPRLLSLLKEGDPVSG